MRIRGNSDSVLSGLLRDIEFVLACYDRVERRARSRWFRVDCRHISNFLLSQLQDTAKYRTWPGNMICRLWLFSALRVGSIRVD